ncbi:MAG: hypothetical protein JWO52_2770 [Gammaproteobacteria bacterium]|jgi:hypothetical protein|nr:hypothetical protein [Gammaproteobacteria bacterium]
MVWRIVQKLEPEILKRLRMIVAEHSAELLAPLDWDASQAHP